MKRAKSDSGFPIVEMAIATTVAGTILVAAFSITFSLLADYLKASAQAQMVVESQNILQFITDDVRFASSIVNNNTVTDANPLSGSTWTTGDVTDALVLQIPTLDASGAFIIDSATGDPYPNEIVYFADGASFYRRTLANPAAVGNNLTTTCPIAIASPSCPADATLTDDLFNGISFTFYDQDDTVISGGDVSAARSVDITLTISKNVFGRQVDFDNSIRMTLRN